MTHEFLQPFYQATLEQQMEWASIDQVLENMDILFKQFEDAKVKYVDNAHMVNSVHMGWWVLSKYYEESDKNPINATALLLHPEKRRLNGGAEKNKGWSTHACLGRGMAADGH
ncbi:hypothetical protein MAA_01602 [Metarhizium robertsii ARSEF 23]|uniref:Uncharacterized protein n=1 Tax=Metarhizium robertsii (strain ARSEF 23 / ATCC MYA-3075) TaxID=655844 RepID=E9EMA0_METRA|nr:uncharacterized protein MAA_01602 [Metarhizium robertsii ARSEF 23]EFZ04528.1 hypothetical protein MAA_01602 [Metarhizium robertsii ARSEF 23]